MHKLLVIMECFYLLNDKLSFYGQECEFNEDFQIKLWFGFPISSKNLNKLYTF